MVQETPREPIDDLKELLRQNQVIMEGMVNFVQPQQPARQRNKKQNGPGLGPSQKFKDQKENRCFICHKPGRFQADCPPRQE